MASKTAERAPTAAKKGAAAVPLLRLVFQPSAITTSDDPTISKAAATGAASVVLGGTTPARRSAAAAGAATAKNPPPVPDVTTSSFANAGRGKAWPAAAPTPDPNYFGIAPPIVAILKRARLELRREEATALRNLTALQRCTAIGMDVEGRPARTIVEYLLSSARGAAARRPSTSGAVRAGGNYSRQCSTEAGGATNSGRTTPRRGTSGFYEAAVEQQRLFRQGSADRQRQQQHLRQVRQAYDAPYQRTNTPPSSSSAAVAARATNAPTTPRTPIWMRPTTPRTVDRPRAVPPAPGTPRAQALSALANSRHRMSYLPPAVASAAQKAAHTLWPQTSPGVAAALRPFARSMSSMTPPPTLRKRDGGLTSGGLRDDDEADDGAALVASPAPRDPNAPMPRLSLTGPHSPHGSGHIGSVTLVDASPVFCEQDEHQNTSRDGEDATPSDPLLAVLSATRTAQWLREFVGRLGAMQFSEAQWEASSPEQQEEFFSEWALPHIQRRLVRSRYTSTPTAAAAGVVG